MTGHLAFTGKVTNCAHQEMLVENLEGKGVGVNKLNYLLTCLLTYLLLYLFTYLLAYLLIYLFTYLLACLLTSLLT